MVPGPGHIAFSCVGIREDEREVLREEGCPPVLSELDPLIFVLAATDVLNKHGNDLLASRVEMTSVD